MKSALRPLLLAAGISSFILPVEAQPDSLAAPEDTLAAAGEDVITLFGTVAEPQGPEVKVPLSRGSVTATDVEDAAFAHTALINGAGQYELQLPFGRSYRVVFEARDFVPRHVLIDARNVPPEDQVGGVGMGIDMRLIRDLPGLDHALCDRPAGIAQYDPAEFNLAWDADQLAQAKAEWNAFLEKYYRALKKARK